MKNIIINTVLILILSILTLTTIVSADEIQRSRCQMTINSAKHPSSSTPANATGDCSGLVFGFYNKEQDAFRTSGMVRYDVEHSGQQFIVATPAGQYAEAVLTVYTVKETPKPTPAPAPKPTQPKVEPKKETQVTQPKVEPEKETIPKTDTTSKTKTQETSRNTVKKTEETNKPVINNSLETEQGNEKETTVAKVEDEEVDEDVQKEEEKAEEIEEDDEVAVVSTEKKSETDSNSPLLLTIMMGIVVIILAGLGTWWFKFRSSKSRNELSR